MYSSLLEKFRDVPASRKEVNLTIFEICGFPHFENVVSNVLAFFLDADEVHGLGSLLIESLLDAAEEERESLDLQLEVEREVQTKTGKFIDLFLHNDSCRIVVENKIFAPLYNDLDDYEAFAKTDSVTLICIVLSLRSEKPKNENFINVTYPDLIAKLKGNLGRFVGEHDPKYLMLLLDLVKNIENLSQPKNTMNEEFLDFVNENPVDVQRFGAELKGLHDQLRKIVKQVNGAVVDLAEDGSIRQGMYRKLPELFDMAVSDFKIPSGMGVASGTGIAFDSIVKPKGWEFHVFVRTAGRSELDLTGHCTDRGVHGQLDERRRLVLDDKLPFETSPDKVAEKIVELIDKIRS